MQHSNVRNSQQLGHQSHTLAIGAARSLRPRCAMALRVTQGGVWVTLGDGLGQDGDVFLHAGQTLWLASGSHAVIEPLGMAPLHYSLSSVGRLQAARRWWLRAQMGPCDDEVCWA